MSNVAPLNDASVRELETPANLSLEDITDGQNERGIPLVRFLEDITAFSDSFTPPATAELLIGAYSDLFGKFKGYEASLTQRRKWDLGRNKVFIYFGYRTWHMTFLNRCIVSLIHT